MQPGDDAQPSGRLVQLYFKGADGTRVPAGSFLDKQTGQRCGLTLAPGSAWSDPTPAYLCTPGAAPVSPGDAGKYVRFTMEQ